jgi:hypothetical protein
MKEQGSKLRQMFGITPHNPFAIFAVIFTVLTIIALIILLYFTFAGSTARSRFNIGVVFLAVGVFAQIPLAFLFIYAGNYARIQSIVAGNYWAKWQDKHREVYISPLGIHYPDQRFTLHKFSDELQKVEIPSDSPSVIRFNYLVLRKYSPTSQTYRHNKKIEVRIPEGKEEEARALVQRFQQTQIGQPSDFIAHSWRIGLMMGAGILGFALLWGIFLAWPLQKSLDAEKVAIREAERAALEAKQIEKLMPILSSIRKVIDPQIERLKTMPRGQLSATEAGFDESAGVDKVFYGPCYPGPAFYVWVVLKKDVLERRYLSANEPGTFYYDTKTDQYRDCGPPNLSSGIPLKLSDGWYYGSFYATK